MNGHVHGVAGSPDCEGGRVRKPLQVGVDRKREIEVKILATWAQVQRSRGGRTLTTPAFPIVA